MIDLAGFDTLFENIIEGRFSKCTSVADFVHDCTMMYMILRNQMCTVLEQSKDPFTNLQSIDLSFNELTKIDASVIKYPNIKSLYLHGNSIENFNEIKKLKTMNNLRRLTLHGNPIGNILNICLTEIKWVALTPCGIWIKCPSDRRIPLYICPTEIQIFQIRCPNIELV